MKVNEDQEHALGSSESPLDAPESVRVGQIWADNDSRSNNGSGLVRHIEIRQIVFSRPSMKASYAICWSYYNNYDMRRKVRIKISRFKPTASGYRLLRDAPDASTERETET